MANYTRRAQDDISRFLREGNLNAVHANDPEEDLSMADNQLSLFMEKDFLDFDTGLKTNFKPDSPPEAKPTESVSALDMVADFSGMDYINTAGDFGFDYSSTTFASPISSGFPDSLQALQPSPHNAYASASHADAFGHQAVGQAKTSEKRRTTHSQQTTHVHNRALSIEEASRVAAEEDKRRRNTAASARFRVKKKQREAALEKSAKELHDKMAALESKITLLETENTWLKQLVLEKNSARDTKEDKTKDAKDNGTKDEITVKEVEAKKDKSS